MEYSKSRDAEQYWQRIGYSVRYIYGGILSASPRKIATKRWQDLPLGIRSKLSKEMNRLQNRINKTEQPLSENDKKKYRIRDKSAMRRPRDNITEKTWNRIYNTSIPHKNKQKRVRRIILDSV